MISVKWTGVKMENFWKLWRLLIKKWHFSPYWCYSLFIMWLQTALTTIFTDENNQPWLISSNIWPLQDTRTEDVQVKVSLCVVSGAGGVAGEGALWGIVFSPRYAGTLQRIMSAVHQGNRVPWYLLLACCASISAVWMMSGVWRLNMRH